MALIATTDLLEDQATKPDPVRQAPKPSERAAQAQAQIDKVKETTPGPSALDTLGAAFREENVFGQQFRKSQSGVNTYVPGIGMPEPEPLDPNFNPFDGAENDPEISALPQLFVGATSKQDVEARRVWAQKMLRDREILGKSGAFGIVSQVAAGVLDPLILIPVSGPITIGKTVGKAAQIGKGIVYGAGTGAVLGSAALATQEGALRNIDPTRSGELITRGAVTGAIVGGILGGGLGGIVAAKMSREINAIIKGTDDVLVDPKTGAQALGPRSAGAQEVDIATQAADEGLVGLRKGTIKAVSPIPALRTPVQEAMVSRFTTIKALTNALFEHNFLTGKGVKGTADKTAESYIRTSQADVLKTQLAADNEYFKYVGVKKPILATVREGAINRLATRHKKLTPLKFNEEVAKTIRKGEKHPIPEVNTVAAAHKKLYSQKLKELQELDESFKGLKNYVPQKFNTQLIAQNPQQFITFLAKKFEQANKSLDYTDALEQAQKSYDNIMGQGDAALNIDAYGDSVLGVSGKATKSRKIYNISPEELEPWLVNDATLLMHQYINSVSRYIGLHKALKANGYENLNDVLKGLTLEKERLIMASPDKAAKITKEYAKAKTQVKEFAEIVTGRIRKDKFTSVGRSLRIFRKYMVSTRLGGVLASSIPDGAMHVLTNGLPESMKAVYTRTALAFAKNTKKLSRNELIDLRISLDVELNRTLNIASTGTFDDVVSRGGEKVADAVQETFGKMTGLPYWNQLNKRIAGTAATSRYARMMMDYKKTGKIAPKDIQELATVGISKTDYERIADQLNRYGEKYSGGFLAHTDKWADKEAKQLFTTAVGRNVESTVLTPGMGDIPRLIQRSEWAATLFQFKSFPATATNKLILKGIQKADINAGMAFVSITLLGYLSYVIKSHVAGKEPESDIGTILEEGITRSGMIGLVGDYVWALQPWFGGASRYAAMNSAGVVGGPGWGAAQDFIELMAELGDEEFGAQDLDKVSRFLPYQNLFYLRLLMQRLYGDEIEAAKKKQAKREKRNK